MAKGGNGKGRGKGLDKDGANDQTVIIGTDGDDILIGTDGNDSIFGLGGDDTLIGGAGNDTLDGGEGSDTYITTFYEGVDTYNDTGTFGWDVLIAGNVSTHFYMHEFSPDSGIEEISSGGFNNVLIEGTHLDDYLDFSSTVLTGIYAILGNEGNDVIIGSQGDDYIDGGLGNDVLSGGGGSDILNGNGGDDTFKFTDANDGVDEIRDFTVGEDTIDISGVTGTITYEQRGDDATLLVDGSDFAVFLNTDIGDLI